MSAALAAPRRATPHPLLSPTPHRPAQTPRVAPHLAPRPPSGCRYEPVWAIGTGLTATPEVAQETHAYIRSWFVENYSQEVADAVVIQYGGSVNDNNVDDLMACADIDGALVGGASLKADSFGRIVNYVKK